MSQTEQLTLQQSVDAIHKNCFLVYVRVSRWPGQYVIKDAEVKVGYNQVDKKQTTAPRWKFVPEEWSNRFQQIESQVRACVAAVSTNLQSSIYLVPRKAAQSLAESVDRLRQTYMEAVNEFVAEWPSIKDGIRHKICAQFGYEVWNSVDKQLPEDDRIAEKFGVELGLWPMGMTGESFLGEEDLAEWMHKAQDTTTRMLNQAIDSMLTDPLREFVEAVQNLEGIREREGVCRNGTLQAIQRAYEKLKAFEFMLPSSMLERLQEASRKLNLTEARDINRGSAASSALVGELRSISQDLAREIAEEESPRRKRSLLL